MFSPPAAGDRDPRVPYVPGGPRRIGATLISTGEMGASAVTALCSFKYYYRGERPRVSASGRSSWRREARKSWKPYQFGVTRPVISSCRALQVNLELRKTTMSETPCSGAPIDQVDLRSDLSAGGRKRSECSSYTLSFQILTPFFRNP